MAHGGSLLSTLYKERSNSWQLQKILAVEKDADAIFEALDLLGQDDTVKFDATAYTIGISACAKVAQTQRACELLNASLRAKVEADVVCFNAAISACDKGEKWQEAFRLCLGFLLSKFLRWKSLSVCLFFSGGLSYVSLDLIKRIFSLVDFADAHEERITYGFREMSWQITSG